MDYNNAFKKLEDLRERGWSPLLNILDGGWHCCLTHKNCPTQVYDYDGKRYRHSEHPLLIHVKGQKTVIDAIMIAVKLAEATDAEQKE